MANFEQTAKYFRNITGFFFCVIDFTTLSMRPPPLGLVVPCVTGLGTHWWPGYSSLHFFFFCFVFPPTILRGRVVHDLFMTCCSCRGRTVALPSAVLYFVSSFSPSISFPLHLNACWFSRINLVILLLDFVVLSLLCFPSCKIVATNT